MPGNTDYDVFFSHSSRDHLETDKLLKALTDKGLKVWYDDKDIQDYVGITKSVEQGLAHSKILLAYYSHNYPKSRSCQYELTSAIITAHKIGNFPTRVLAVNPEKGYDHIHPLVIRDELQPNRYLISGDYAQIADTINDHVQKISTVFEGIVRRENTVWYGKTGIGSRRFVGRFPAMWELHSALHENDFYMISKSHAPALVQLIGMGGIGKSLLAEEYALWFASAFPGGVFWLNAFGNYDAKASLKHEEREAERVRQLLDIACIYGVSTDGKKPNEIIAELNRKLIQCDLPFLWIVDDLPAGMNEAEVKSWFAPTGSQGRTLITSRISSYDAFGKTLNVDPLEPEEAFELLSKWKNPRDDENAARELAKSLGYHPLALDIAGAQLKRSLSKCPFSDFNRELADRSSDTLEELAREFAGLLPTGHEKSIAKTFLFSIDQLDKEGRDFLILASMLATAPIPGVLVSKIFSKIDAVEEKVGKKRAENAIALVEHHSLAKYERGDIPSWGVHTLISRTVLIRFRQKKRFSKMQVAALDAAIEIFSIIQDGCIHPELELIFPHARELINFKKDLKTAKLMGWLAEFERWRGSYASAINLYNRVLVIQRHTGDDETSKILVTMGNLAITFREAGQLAKARKLQEYVLARRLKIYGKNTRETIVAMSNLSMTLGVLGKVTESRELQEEALDLSKKYLGPKHPDTLVIMGSLASTLDDLGEYTKSQELHEQSLALSKEILGPKHPDTLISMGNLAYTFHNTGDYVKAQELELQVLDLSREVLGTEHPNTLTAMNNLSDTLSHLNKTDQARILQEQVFIISKKNLGPDHPDTIIAMNGLGRILFELNDFTKAQELQEKVLIFSTKIWGSKHPHTIRSMISLAGTFATLENFTKAQELQEQALDLLIETLGPEHPMTSNAVITLMAILFAQKKYRDGEKVMKSHIKVLLDKNYGDHNINQQKSLEFLYLLKESLQDN
ncbi:tetratricopeptide repeat protein [Methanoregula sp. UBA64]|jgi:tetratricopeptide (TPR) repeat protein|uniref:tetratricopeptide repeat protein n=1 Tax=Methanoregula sp. UBA64 TaxID=1915554 RepID=UPI0025E546E0|nr:toll/interleukin-1 receptor domain-containing protein [Methanoregula sp. UBA64]